jgi:hypothetical protein
MRAVVIAALLALVPAAAAPQARPAGTVRETLGAQAQPAPEPPAQEAVDLGPAAERLESGAVEGTSAAAPTGEAVPPPDSYTVKPGDTLWDLSGRFLNNPWYWPKVWSYNPEIPNPHWIYPGNQVRFFPATEGQPARVEPVGPQQAVVEDEGLESPRELDDFSRADMKAAQDYGEGDEVAVAGPYKVGYVSPKGVLGRRDTFVTARELEESGLVSAAFEDKLLLSVHDKLYVRFRDPAAMGKVGRTYTIFRTVRPVLHPRTKEQLGWQTQVVGYARAVASDQRTTSVVVTQANDPIERGDRITEVVDRTVKMVPRRTNQRSIQGTIVSTEREATWLSAEHHLVFVDRGMADGVEEGNVFTVVRAGDPYGREIDRDRMSLQEDPFLPAEVVGELLVVDAKERFSTALVVRSLRELFAGDRVEMRVGAPGRTAAR